MPGGRRLHIVYLEGMPTPISVVACPPQPPRAIHGRGKYQTFPASGGTAARLPRNALHFDTAPQDCSASSQAVDRPRQTILLPAARLPSVRQRRHSCPRGMRPSPHSSPPSTLLRRRVPARKRTARPRTSVRREIYSMALAWDRQPTPRQIPCTGPRNFLDRLSRSMSIKTGREILKDTPDARTSVLGR